MSGRLILLCGLAGAGKTTLAKQLEADGAVRMCPDDWLMALGFDIYDKDARVAVELRFLDAPVDVLTARVAERNRTASEGTPRIDPALVAFWDTRIERPDAEELALFD